MMYGPGTTVAEQLAELELYQGGDFVLQSFGVTHAELHVKATHPESGSADLCFLLTQYLDCPVALHCVHIRLPTEEERTDIYERVPDDLKELYTPEFDLDEMGLNPRLGQLVVEGTEGRAVIWAGGLFITPGDTPVYRFR